MKIKFSMKSRGPAMGQQNTRFIGGGLHKALLRTLFTGKSPHLVLISVSIHYIFAVQCHHSPVDAFIGVSDLIYSIGINVCGGLSTRH